MHGLTQAACYLTDNNTHMRGHMVSRHGSCVDLLIRTIKTPNIFQTFVPL